jgi:hypothetical protein
MRSMDADARIEGFNEAVREGNTAAALAHARQIGSLGTESALELLILLGEAKDPLYEKAAERWLERFRDSRRRWQQEMEIARAAVDGLTTPEIAHKCAQILRSLTSPVEVKW